MPQDPRIIYPPDSGLQGRVDTQNSTGTPLGGGATYTGAWVYIVGLATITVNAAADVAGTLWADFSDDASTVRRSVQLSNGSSGAFGIHALAPVNSYYRVRVVNGATPQGAMSLESILYGGHKQIVSRAAQTVGDYTDVINVRQLSEPLLDEARNLQGDRRVVQKFGRNPSVGAGTHEDIWSVGGRLGAAWLQAADTVRVAAGGDPNDTAAGSGARSVFISGLDANWDEATEEVATAGAGASASTATSFVRVNRCWVGDVGTYTGANAATITIETTGGITVASINMDASGTVGLGQTQMCVYTVPDGWQAYVRRVAASVDGSKAADVYFFRRDSADDVSAPMAGGSRVWHVIAQLSGAQGDAFASYIGPFSARTDLWAAAVGPTGGGGISAEMDIVLVRV